MTSLGGDSDGLPSGSSPVENVLNRTCTVEINNSCGVYTLGDPGVFLVSGLCAVPLAPEIVEGAQASASFTKTWGTATGAVGVFTYDLFHNTHRHLNAVLAVMYSVPFDYNLYSNWCAVGIFYRGIECDYALYDLMYNGAEVDFVRVVGGGAERTHEGEIVAVTGGISASSRAVLRVEVKDL